MDFCKFYDQTGKELRCLNIYFWVTIVICFIFQWLYKTGLRGHTWITETWRFSDERLLSDR